MQARVLIGVMAVGAGLAGCMHKPPPMVEAPPPALPPHIGPPPARGCTIAPFHVTDGGIATVDMKVSNEGGYCAATLTAASGQPYDAPLVPVEARHGTVRAIKYNHRNSIEYVPEAGFAGTDNFTVRMIVKGVAGYTTLNVRVAVESAH